MIFNNSTSGVIRNENHPGGPENYNQTFTYDRYGNADCSGSGYCAWPSYDAATNHVTGTGVTYDAAGNMTSDWAGLGNKTYQWDGEGRMTSVAVNGGSSETFTYNAFGQRVERTATCWPWTTATCDEIYDAFGNLALIDRVSGGLVIYVPRVGGRQFAEYSNGYTWFSHSTALGSTGTVTDQAGNLLQGEIYYPWGQRWATSGGVWWDRFASMPKVRDVESGLDPTPNRMYTSQYGRWLSPDPLAGDITNPQSLNRYAYVLNNPASLTDADGAFVQACNPDQGFCNWGLPGQGGGGAVAGYYGGGPGGCSVDGVQVSCGSLSGLGSNAIAPCPNNICQGFATDKNGVTHIVQFWAFAGAAAVANGYYPGTGPLSGSAVGVYWSLAYHPYVMQHHNEIRGIVYEDTRAGIYAANVGSPGPANEMITGGAPATPDYANDVGGWFAQSAGDAFNQNDRTVSTDGNYMYTWMSTSTGRVLQDQGPGTTCVLVGPNQGVYSSAFGTYYPSCH